MSHESDCGECPSCRVNAAVQRLTEIMEPTGVLQWYKSRNENLDNQVPEALIFVGQHERVIQEIERLVGGVSWQHQNTISEPMMAPPGTLILPMARSEFKEKLEQVGLGGPQQNAIVDNIPGDTPILMALQLTD